MRTAASHCLTRPISRCRLPCCCRTASWPRSSGVMAHRSARSRCCTRGFRRRSKCTPGLASCDPCASRSNMMTGAPCPRAPRWWRLSRHRPRLHRRSVERDHGGACPSRATSCWQSGTSRPVTSCESRCLESAAATPSRPRMFACRNRFMSPAPWSTSMAGRSPVRAFALVRHWAAAVPNGNPWHRTKAWLNRVLSHVATTTRRWRRQCSSAHCAPTRTAPSRSAAEPRLPA